MKAQFFSVLALVAPFAFGAVALTPRTDVTVSKPINAPEVAGTLTLFLSAVDSIPVSVLEAGDAATDAYLVAAGLRQPGTPISARTDISVVGERDVAAAAGLLDIIKCALAIGELILDAAIPAAKLLQVKKAIEALGGVKKAAELLLKAKDIKDALKLGGEALKEIWEVLTSFKDVKKACT